MSLFYADSSALVKLIREEPESASLRLFLEDADVLTSELVLTEVPRAVRRAAADDPRLALDALLRQTAELLETIALLPLDRAVLLTAASLKEPTLRALDAIHIASATSVSPLDAFISYDERQSAAARLANCRTLAPGI